MDEETSKIIGVLNTAIAILRGDLTEALYGKAIKEDRKSILESFERKIYSTSAEHLKSILGEDALRIIREASDEVDSDIIKKLHGIKD